MRLPNAHRAVVDPSKVCDYLLSPSHPVGRFKATVFFALGYVSADWEVLRDDLLGVARTGNAVPGQPSSFGQKYEVDAILTAPSGRSAPFRTIWILDAESEAPRFITAFPRQAMFKLLDTVALTHDVISAGLRLGDLGAIVEVLSPNAFEVEFVAASGRTQALLTLGSEDVRHVGDRDLMAVRSLEPAGG